MRRRRRADRLGLARKLLQQALETNGDAASQFVLLHESRELATQSSDCEQAFQAIAELAKRFDIDVVQMKSSTLAVVSKIGFYQTQSMTSPPKGDFDAVSLHFKFDSTQGISAWIIFDGGDRAAWVDSKAEVFVGGRKEGTTWHHDHQVKWARRDEGVITILLVEGEYILYLDSQEMARMKTPASRITLLTLKASDGPVKFDRIRLRKVE